MNLEDILAAGATVSAGRIDFKNRNIGVLTQNGPELTQSGLEFLENGGRVKKRGPGRPPKHLVEDAVEVAKG